MERISLTAGAELFQKDDPDDAVYYVQQGQIVVVAKHDASSDPNPLSTAGPGECPGSMLRIVEALVMDTDCRRDLSAVAGTAGASLLRLPITAVRELVAEDPSERLLLQLVCAVVSRYIHVEHVVLTSILGLYGEAAWCHMQESGIELTELRFPADKRPTSKVDRSVIQYVGVVRQLASLFGCEEGQLHNCTVRTIMQDEVISDVGDREHDLVFLISGALQHMCTMDADAGREIWFSEVAQPGSLHGLLQLFTGEPAITTLVAKTESVVLIIPGESVDQLLHDAPNVLPRLVQIFFKRMPSLCHKLNHALHTVQLEAGNELYDQDDVADTLYLVLNGRLRSVYRNHKTDERTLDCEYGRSEIIAEQEVMTPSTRSTSVHAVRDSVLVKIPLALVHNLHAHSPSVLPRLQRKVTAAFTQQEQPRMIQHIRKSAYQTQASMISSTRGKFGTIAIVPACADVPILDFGRQLAKALRSCSQGSAMYITKATVQDAISIDPQRCRGEESRAMLNWLTKQEMAHSLIIYEAEFAASPWTQRCVRQADCVFIVGLGDTLPRLSPIEEQFENLALRAQVELVLLHSPATTLPSGTAAWLNMRGWCSRHYHLRFAPDGEHQCVERLARRIVGTSVGVVFGGGGAKGFAHLGVIQGMHERGIPIDYIGGTSIGSFVAGAYALEGGSFEHVTERCHAMARRMQYLIPLVLDLTYPVVSMLTGRAFNRVIQKSLELEGIAGREVLMEDLWLPCFAVSTDVSVMKQRVHLHGCLWRYVRASMTLQGYLPPICDPDSGNLLLDGGYVNNLPVDVMRKKLQPDFIIGIDVEAKEEKTFSNYGDAVSGWYVLASRWRSLLPWRWGTASLKVPTSIELQGRLAYMSNSQKLNSLLKNERFEYLRPPIEPFGTLSWSLAHTIQDVGYNYGQTRLDQVKALWSEKVCIETAKSIHCARRCRGVAWGRAK